MTQSGIIWATELSHTWPTLAVSEGAAIAAVALPVSVGVGAARIGVDAYGARHFLVPAGDDDVRGDDVDGALTVRLRTYGFAREPTRYLDIVCARSDLFDLFDTVLVEVLDNVDGSRFPAATAAEVVERWRALMSTRRSPVLPVAAQMALFAELTVLVMVTGAAEVDVDWWHGPFREPHDIVAPRFAVEVKAVGAAATTVEIHGLDQLEPPGRPLALALLEITDDDSGQTLPDLVDEVVRRANDPAALIRKLAAGGYESDNADRYSVCFSVRRVSYIEVDDSIPRVTDTSFGPDGVPNGVVGVDYRLALDVLAPALVRGRRALAEWAAQA